MKKTAITRRGFAAAGAALLAGSALPSRAQQKGPYVADMHSHYGMFLPRLFGLDLSRHMRESGAMLIAWAVTDDHRWISLGPQGWRQARQPEPGELWESFQRRLADNEAKLKAWNVAKALTPADVDAALAGEPRVLLATEAANFLEGRPERVAQAHAWGVRHMQMVHFYIARSLSPVSARKIAARGGAVGLWTVRVRDPAYPVHNVRTFADETMRMCDLLGPEHVAFGTDMEGAGPGPILSNYVDLRDVADNLGKRGLGEAALESIFIGNYARIVKQAMNGATIA